MSGSGGGGGGIIPSFFWVFRQGKKLEDRERCNWAPTRLNRKRGEQKIVGRGV